MSLSRRSFLAASSLPLLAQKKDKNAGPRPNIVLLLADSLPAFMTGCHGNPVVRTPNLDLLAKTGVRYLNCFAATTDVAASLTVLMSGRSPVQASASPLLPQALSASGYRTVEVNAAGAMDAIDQQAKGTPFFLTISLPLAAAPYDGLEAKYYDQYKAVSFDQHGWLLAAATAAEGKEYAGSAVANLRKAAAAITALDDQLAPIRRRLYDKGLVDNTVIVFTSLRGGLYGRHGLWGAAKASNPLNFFDEAVHVPLVMAWPGLIPVQSARPEVVSHADFFLSMCDAAGVAPPAGREATGRSYFGLAVNRPMPKGQRWRDIAFAAEGDTAMARDNRFKLISRNNGQGPNEFYDLRTDPREFKNLYNDPQFVTVRDDLSGQLRAWIEIR